MMKLALITGLLLAGSIAAITVHAQAADQYYQQSKNQGPVEDNLPDYSHAGHFSQASQAVADTLSTVYVSDYGAIADDNHDDIRTIQQTKSQASAWLLLAAVILC